MRQFFSLLIRVVVAIAMTGALPLLSQEMEYLGREDVNRVMEQIFDRHIAKKEMTEEIMRDSLKLYIEQFDPAKIYFLEWEVQPFINPSDYEMKQYLADYSRNTFTPFRRIDTLIRKAITRARNIREQQIRDQEALFQTRLGPEFYDSLPYASYPKNKKELSDRIRFSTVDYIERQRDRYGEEPVSNRKDLILTRFNRDKESWENSYLYLSDTGVALNDKQKEHQFTLHVLKALSKSLDSHTSVFDNSEAYSIRTRLLKGHPGVGIEFEQKLEGIVVNKIAPGSPASRAEQIEPDDRLIKIDGKEVDTYTFSGAMKLLEGGIGTPVTLTFEKRTGNRYRVTLKRETIVSNIDRVETSAVPYKGGVIGKITLHSFYDNKNGISSEADIREALQDFRKQGALKGLILDLRNNSGGYLSQAVKVAGLFITNGVIVISKYHDGNVTYYRDVDGKTYFDGPLVVLISRVTASAAEIVAQALQDYGVAVVVGDDHSYGKGTIQSQTVTGDKSPSYFKVTVGQYYTVSGKTPQVKGVLADVVVPGELAFQNIGESGDLNGSETIAPAFTDQLSDIKPDARPWYFRYYLPTLQPRKTSWQKMIPDLQRLSRTRIGGNRTYGLSNQKQMDEAVKIVEDMIRLRSELNKNQLGAFE